MLLQIKASLNHGEWLPWLNGEIESGRLEVKSTQARVYMRVASNKQRGVYLEETPSIRAALELLSDKEPEEQQGSLIDAEAERQARVAAEAKAAEEREARERFEQRARESQADPPHGVFSPEMKKPSGAITLGFFQRVKMQHDATRCIIISSTTQPASARGT